MSKGDFACVFSTKDQQQLLTLLQIMDSGFPTGGFSHSQGLEAWVQHKGKKSLMVSLVCLLENAGSFAVSFVRAAYCSKNQEKKLSELDELCHACIPNHVAAKASMRQGMSLLETAISVFGQTSLSNPVVSTLRQLPHCHMEVVHGSLLAALGFDLDTTLTSFMFGVLRTATSAAVRLDVLGSIESQKAEHKMAQLIPDILYRNATRDVSQARTKFPALEVLQNTQDTLFCKLFYS